MIADVENKEFFQPQSRQEVVELRARYGNRALLLGGGTFLHGLLARGFLPSVEALIDLQNLGLSYVKVEDGTLAIGATTTFAELQAAEPIRGTPGLGALRDALQYPPPQIRNTATVGGCIASATPLFDLPVALLALDAIVTALGPQGSREMELGQFFCDYFEHALEEGEFLTELRVPVLPLRTGSAFLKLETNANDLALLSVGVRITLGDSGLCQEARVVAGGGVGKAPVRALASEKLLKGERPSEPLLEQSAQAVSADVHPISDHRASAAYRAAMARVFTKRALGLALARLGVNLS